MKSVLLFFIIELELDINLIQMKNADDDAGRKNKINVIRIIIRCENVRFEEDDDTH